MSRRPSNGAVMAVATLLFVVVANLVVPGAGQQCAAQDSQSLAVVSSLGATNGQIPTVAQRVHIGDSPVIISNVSLTFYTATDGVVEVQIRGDNGVPSTIASDLYISNLPTVPGTSSSYTFFFANGAPELAANTYYWIVFTSPSALAVQWFIGQVQNATESVNVDAGSAYGSAESIPADQVPSLVVWSSNAPGTAIVALGIQGCVLSAMPSPAASPSSIATSTPKPTRSPAPTDAASTTTPRASPSTSQAVVLIPITANVTSSFDSTQTALNLTAPASTNATSGLTQPGVTVVSQFSEVQVGNRTLPPPAIQELTVSNDTSTNTTTYAYISQIENATDVEQSFTFFEQNAIGNFSGLPFDVRASSIKWSIRLLASNSTNATAGGVTLRYRLTGLAELNATGGVVASRGRVIEQRGTPQANMTTYLVPLFLSTTSTASTTTTRTTAAQVELFDVALVDGARFVPIKHSIVRTADAEYVVELELPGFNESLFYDPSIGLGVLLGHNDRDDGSGGSESDVGLIVGVAVAIPVAVAIVLVVIGAAVIIAWRQKRLARRVGAINFEANDDDDDHHDRL